MEKRLENLDIKKSVADGMEMFSSICTDTYSHSFELVITSNVHSKHYLQCKDSQENVIVLRANANVLRANAFESEFLRNAIFCE